MSIVTDLQTLITNANATLTELNGLIDQLEEQYPPTWCYEFDFTQTDGDFATAGGLGLGVHTANGWQGSPVSNGYSIYISRSWSPAVQISRVEVDVAYAVGGAGCNLYGSTDSETLFDLYNVTSNTFVWTGTLNASALYLNPSSGVGSGGQVSITRLKIVGSGANPFGETNC
jgi:hypothetical protein